MTATHDHRPADPPSSTLGLSRSRIYSNCTKRSAVSCRGVDPLASARQPVSQAAAHRHRRPLPQQRVPHRLVECPGANVEGSLWLREAALWSIPLVDKTSTSRRPCDEGALGGRTQRYVSSRSWPYST